jgi:hypothetical protein
VSQQGQVFETEDERPRREEVLGLPLPSRRARLAARAVAARPDGSPVVSVVASATGKGPAVNGGRRTFSAAARVHRLGAGGRRWAAGTRAAPLMVFIVNCELVRPTPGRLASRSIKSRS